MSDRRPEMWMPCEHGMLHEHFWNYPPGKGEQCSGGRWAESADLLAVVRRGVESGTIEGRISNAEQFNDEKGWVESFVDFHGRCLIVPLGPVSDGGSET